MNQTFISERRPRVNNEARALRGQKMLDMGANATLTVPDPLTH